MNLALIDKDLFASLLRYGEVILPTYSFRSISDESQIQEALRSILRSGNPIEYPSQYIIVVCDNFENNKLLITSVKKLIATDADGMRLFSFQFRNDLIIKPEKYQDIFQEYLKNDFQKERIIKGIVYFRKLCHLSDRDNYDDEANIIYRGMNNRIKYHHHYDLPAKERTDPYAFMISYDRYAPYPREDVGYFYDLIELCCYYRRKDTRYSESIIEQTDVYKQINALPPDKKSQPKSIDEAIMNEKFTQYCNTTWSKPGGYWVPYLFFMLRDRFRDSDSFTKQRELIERMKNLFSEAFDTASIFVGGFFGYEKFYDDYYSMLNLCILRSQKPSLSPELTNSVYIDDKTNPVARKTELTEGDAPSSHSEDTKVDGVTTESQVTKENGPVCPEIGGMFCEGPDLYKKLYDCIDDCSSKDRGKRQILNWLERNKENDRNLLKFEELIENPSERRDEFKNLLGLSTYPNKLMKKIRDSYKK